MCLSSFLYSVFSLSIIRACLTFIFKKTCLSLYNLPHLPHPHLDVSKFQHALTWLQINLSRFALLWTVCPCVNQQLAVSGHMSWMCGYPGLSFMSARARLRNHLVKKPWPWLVKKIVITYGYALRLNHQFRRYYRRNYIQINVNKYLEEVSSAKKMNRSSF